MSSSRPLGIKKASSAYLKLISAALVTMSISVQSANAQKSSITLENALKRTLSNNPDLVVFEFKSSALDGVDPSIRLQHTPLSQQNPVRNY